MKKKQCRGRFVKGFVVLTAMILVSLLCACTEKETPEDKALQEAENWVQGGQLNGEREELVVK